MTVNRKIKRTLILAGLAFALLCLVGGIYFGTFCHASPEAKALVRGSETVQVKTTDAGWLLDGPGAKDALIFYPGGKVEPTAYLPLLTALAEDGVDCFLVRMPLNMAFLNVNAAADLRAAYAYEHWYIGGHSLGGAMAAVYAAEHGDGLDGLILLAAYATKPLGEHLAVLELHGSEDGVLNRKKLKAGEQYLPASALSFELPGGNHAQFGDYGPQKGDGVPTVSRTEQTAWAVERIEAIILGE